ncbi:FAD-binding domain-containing protein [Caulobacter sp. S45]|uniref:FAD-binding domain-containing protein n=1 Tax=Caulobacter sp. S45 TaxID=1641861 RepID=UPI001C2D5CB3|nr:FAD-binding domain-containing protein [Caulobacter sp. S45]
MSPYLRRRLITEAEVIAAAIDAHGHRMAERFVEEVVWRSYFKGHLETRPAIWTDYKRQAFNAHEAMVGNAGLRRAYVEAVEGRTGIDGFDDWAHDLVEQGWLHNHARMWFASIWIFTLRLPWALGADFFMSHLLDGDPASNTLSWRWVAGLHTRGKAYVARAENIARYTEGRFRPAGLNENVQALTEQEVAPLIELAPADTAPAGEIALLLHLDDLNPESLVLGSARVAKVAAVTAHAEGASEQVRAADQEAMLDALARAGAHFGCKTGAAEPGWEEGLPALTAWAPVGPSADVLPPCIRVRRDWDELTWPKSTRGYFQLRSAIPDLLKATTLSE